MGKKIIRMAEEFAAGAASFVTVPFASCFYRGEDRVSRPRRPPPRQDVSRYFAAAGGYISDACEKVGSARK